HRQHKTTEQIAHSKRFAAPSIARAKPAFEVDCAHFVAAFWRVYSPPGQDWSAPRPPLPLLYQVQPQASATRCSLREHAALQERLLAAAAATSLLPNADAPGALRASASAKPKRASSLGRSAAATHPPKL